MNTHPIGVVQNTEETPLSTTQFIQQTDPPKITVVVRKRPLNSKVCSASLVQLGLLLQCKPTAWQALLFRPCLPGPDAAVVA